MDRIKRMIELLSKVIIIPCLVCSSVFMIFFQSQYHFADYPYFKRTDIGFFIAVFVMAIILCGWLYLGKKTGWNMYIPIMSYVLLSILLIELVPLQPYSDMKEIWDIASANLYDPKGYLSQYNNQIPITLLFYGLIQFFGAHIEIIKIANILCGIGILLCLDNLIITHTEIKDHKGIWFAVLLLPSILYNNHLYNDTLFTLISFAVCCLLTQKKQTIVKDTSIILLLILQYLLRPSGIIYIIAAVIYLIFYKKDYKKCMIYMLGTIAGIVICTTCYKYAFHTDDSKAYPVWSYIQMGINEDEFGFQDGSHDTDWTFQDCVEKYKEYGWKKVLTIYVKKEIWMWTEGTFQAQRYGYGGLSEDLFEKQTIVTKSLLSGIETSKVRTVTEYLMKGQYWIFLNLAILGIWFHRKDEITKFFLIIMCGFCCFYLIWEMKSRYIYSLYPMILYFSCLGYEKACKKIRKYKNTCQTD